jgi:hypothetical protein
MIAAIYARKSTDQAGVADDAKSVTRQVETATAYAVRKAWAVDPAHVYVERRDLRRRVRAAAGVPPADERAQAASAVPGAHHVGGVAPRPRAD